jgi:protein involved in polysaccharide export with SLBB domain
MIKMVYIVLFCLVHSFAVMADKDTHLPLIQKGDLLYLSLPGEESFNQNYSVNRQGNILLPEAGEIHIVGLTVNQAENKVKKVLSKSFRDLNKFHLIVKQHRLLITVLGYVKNPGQIELPAYSNIQTAIKKSGGILAGAQLDRFQVRRTWMR